MPGGTTNDDMALPPRLGRRTTAGSIWLVVSRLGTRGIDLGTLLLLARMLTPADFGLVAVAMTVVQIVEAIFDLPIAQGVIRSRKVGKALLDTAFTLGLLRAAILAALLLALSLPMATMFGDPRLANLQAFLCLSPVLRALTSPAMALFGRDLDFRRDLVVDMAGKACGFGVAIAVARIRHDYWGIAAGTVTAPLASVIASYLVAPYRPALSLHHFQEFAGFLGWATLSQLLSALNWKLCRLVLGGLVAHDVMGRFAMAEDLASVPDQALISVTSRPLMAAFAQLRDHRARLARAYSESLALFVTFGVPLMLCVALVAPSLVPLILGAKWAAVAPMLSMLALAVGLRFYAAPFAPLSLALGRTDRLFAQNLVELSLRLPAVIISARLGGVAAVLVVQVALSAVMALVAIASSARMLGQTCVALLSVVVRPTVGGAVLAAIFCLTEGGKVAPEKWWAAVLVLARLGSALSAYFVTVLVLWHGAGRPDGFEARIQRALPRLLGRTTLAARVGS